jgi:hypothetical protein
MRVDIGSDWNGLLYNYEMCLGVCDIIFFAKRLCDIINNESSVTSCPFPIQAPFMAQNRLTNCLEIHIINIELNNFLCCLALDHATFRVTSITNIFFRTVINLLNGYIRSNETQVFHLMHNRDE